MPQQWRNIMPALAENIQVAAGKTIFDRGDPATGFSLIRSGEVRMYDVMDGGTERLLGILGADDWIGYAALAHFPVHGRRAVAVTDVVLWFFEAGKIRRIVEENADMAVGLIENLAQQLHQAWTEGSRFVFDDCRLRLIKTLLRFSTSPAAHAVPEGVVLRITHKQLAQAVGAARETVSVCLTELRHKKIVKTGRNQLAFDPKDLEQLNKIA
jgi:CRP-like cAMP-binding protein